MVFNYGSGSAIPGFDRRSPLADALGAAWDGFERVVAGVIVIAGSLIPLLLLALILWQLWRRVGRRFVGRVAHPGSPVDPAA